jgi:5-(carboxyamino)imidazole ribonucleotide mutase
MAKANTAKPLVGIIMGSTSDWEVMLEAKKVLDALAVPCEAEVVSAHRTPDRMFTYASSAAGRGLQVIIAGAGGAAHLPGMTAAKTILPVIGVPCPTTQLIGLDALLSIVQMPKGTPVATVAVGKPGAANAGFLAAQIIALQDPALAARILAYKDARRDEVLASRLA